MEQRMKPATSGAADPPSDNNTGRWRRHRSSSPAGAQEGATKRAPIHLGNSRSPSATGRNRNTGGKERLRSADGREREPESRGGTAVHPDGAEADLVRPNRADTVGKNLTDSSTATRRSALRLPFLNSDSKLRSYSSSSPAAKQKETNPGEEGSNRDRGCGAGLGFGLWRGGCLQAELIHFHLQKRLKRRGTAMQTKAENMVTEETAQELPEPAAEATEAGSVTQQDQAIEDEMERLLEENEDLKV